MCILLIIQRTLTSALPHLPMFTIVNSLLNGNGNPHLEEYEVLAHNQPKLSPPQYDSLNPMFEYKDQKQ